MATANYYIDAEDGWTAVTSGGAAFIKIRSNTPNHAFFVTTSGAGAPASTVIGYKVQCDEFTCDVETDEEYYVRTAENVSQETRFDVFSIAPAA